MSATPPRKTAPPEHDVHRMFDGLAQRYDVVNDVLSLGLDRWWRRATAGAVRVPAGSRVLDLGCGTGLLGRRLAGRARVIGLDVSLEMLLRARSRRAGRQPGLGFVQGSAFRLPFADATFAAVVSGFVLRNLHDLGMAFEELARVVAADGRIALADITEPPNALFRRAFDAYFGVVAPAVGGLVGRRDDYRYLVRSLAQLPPPADLCRLLRAAGFDDVRARPLTGGAVTLFTARRGSTATARETQG
jgi:demethylmenaquinone methyltransferase/2-methoxy-6-polyprenyl-1,4-benzoquinol methylase